MLVRLKLNKKYVPAECFDNDEYCSNGYFVWNVSRLIEFIGNNKNNVIFEKINVKDYNSFCSINEEHLPTVDITIPVILIEINPGLYNLIDGQHRVAKATRDGVEQIDAYKLTVNQHINFMSEIKRYEKFVEYWNGKIDDREKRAKKEKKA